MERGPRDEGVTKTWGHDDPVGKRRNISCLSLVLQVDKGSHTFLF